MNFFPLKDYYSGSKYDDAEIVYNRIIERAQGLPIVLIYYFVLTDNGIALTMSTAMDIRNKEITIANLLKIMADPCFQCFAVSDEGEEMVQTLAVEPPPIAEFMTTGSTVNF